jgi:cellulose biosynthesis protein BcsQ
MKRVVFNQKGGVGKTSIACNLAAIGAAMGYRTLVVDLDVQGNTTHYLVGEIDAEAFPAEAQGVAGLYRQTVGPRKMRKNPDSFVWETPYENLFLLPSSPVLAEMEAELESRYKIYKLRDALEKLNDEYDRVYIDTPPSFNFYSKSALIAADSVLIPVRLRQFRAPEPVLAAGQHRRAAGGPQPGPRSGGHYHQPVQRPGTPAGGTGGGARSGRDCRCSSPTSAVP